MGKRFKGPEVTKTDTGTSITDLPPYPGDDLPIDVWMKMRNDIPVSRTTPAPPTCDTCVEIVPVVVEPTILPLQSKVTPVPYKTTSKQMAMAYEGSAEDSRSRTTVVLFKCPRCSSLKALEVKWDSAQSARGRAQEDIRAWEKMAATLPQDVLTEIKPATVAPPNTTPDNILDAATATIAIYEAQRAAEEILARKLLDERRREERIATEKERQAAVDRILKVREREISKIRRAQAPREVSWMGDDIPLPPDETPEEVERKMTAVGRRKIIIEED